MRCDTHQLEAARAAVLQGISPADLPSEHRAIDDLILSLRHTLPACWGDAELIPYGSSIGGFVLHGGDVDVTVVLPRPVPISGNVTAVAEDERHFQQRGLIEWRRSLIEHGWEKLVAQSMKIYQKYGEIYEDY